MKDKLMPKLGDGWSFSEQLRLCEKLLLGIYDKTDHRFFLSYLEDTRFIEVTSHHQTLYGTTITKNADLFFVTEQGFCVYNLKTKVEELLLPLDTDQFCFDRMWLAPDGEILYIIQAKWNIPLSKLHEGDKLEQESSLLKWEIHRSGPKCVAKFEAPPIFSDISWKEKSLFAYTEQKNRKKILRLDLETYETTTVNEPQIANGLIISPRDTLVTWPLWASRIEERLKDGKSISLTESGWFPSFSPQGDKMAFTVSDYELWIRYADGHQTRVFAFFSATNPGAHDTPSWCSCGQHLIVYLDGPESIGAMNRAVVIADVARKEICMHENLLVHGGRVWVPKSISLRQDG